MDNEKERLEYQLQQTKSNNLALVMVMLSFSFACVFGLAANAWKQHESLIACMSGKVSCDIDIRD